MALADLLVHIDSTAQSIKRFKLAMKLAQRHQARLFCLYTQLLPLSLGLSNNRDKRSKLYLKKSEKQLESCRKLAQKTDVEMTWDLAPLPRDEDEVTDQLIHAAQHMDMIVVSQYQHKKMAGILPADLVERLVLETGRPALVIPHAGEFKDVGVRALIAWNTGRESVRAINDAIPLLKRAKTVNVMAIDPHKGKKRHGRKPAADISQHLQRHGIDAKAETLSTRDVDAANMLLSCAADESADLLVMGAYGHHRFRELVLGGVTRDILDHMTVPVLMSH